MLFTKETITSFTKLTLTLKGMRGIEEYEITCSGADAEIARYTRFYTRDEDDRQLVKSVTKPADDVIALMNGYGLLRWDGFDGPNPKNVRDGIMFLLTAQVNGGRTIRAEGSNNYPKHYHEFMSAIHELLYE